MISQTPGSSGPILSHPYPAFLHGVLGTQPSTVCGDAHLFYKKAWPETAHLEILASANIKHEQSLNVYKGWYIQVLYTQPHKLPEGLS